MDHCVPNGLTFLSYLSRTGVNIQSGSSAPNYLLAAIHNPRVILSYGRCRYATGIGVFSR